MSRFLAGLFSKRSKVPKPVNNPAPSPFYQERQGECSICSEKDCKLVNLSKNCQHLASSCASCLKASIVSEIKSKGNHKFQCSSSKCEVSFEPFEYYHLLDQSLIDLVDKLLLHRMLEKNKEFRWCKSSKGCGAGQLVSNHEDLLGYYVCYACGELLCYRHSISWHKGHTCEEFDAAKAKNAGFASDATVMEFCKQCPNDACRTPIMKHEGCDVITCCRFGTHTCAASKGKCDHGGPNYCGQRFCWKCLGKIDIHPTSGAFIRHCKATCEYASLN